MKAARKRVLFLMPSLTGGGAERVIVTLLQYLDRSRFEPHLALVEAAGPYLKEVPADVPLHDLKAKRVRRAFPGIIRLSWKLKPHAIHSTLCEMNMATVLLRPFLPPGVRLLIREGISPGAEGVHTRKHPLVWKRLYRWLYPRADKIICVGDYVADDLADNFRVPRRKLVRIYNPIDIELGRKLASATGNPYEGNGPHLVAAGRLSKQKAFDILLEAMVLVRNSLPNCVLTILGEGDLRSELLAQRERLGLNDAVRLIGFQRNPFPYFQHADLFVLPSRFEGMPAVVIEALAVGTPVVASDCPGAVREVLRDCPIARLVQPSDSKALAETIVSALNSTNRELHPDERLDAYLSRFEAKARVRDYEQIFEA
jgi:glycosyltransferase involved in cell wall biosynthesis